MSKQLVAGIVAVVALIGVGVGVVAVRNSQPVKQPNVLIILWDTVRADRLSMYGYDLDTTPRMKQWADEHGVVFENGISPAMWTVPSHASMFTGVPPSTHGAGFDHRWLDDHHLTLAEWMSQHGYATYAFSANPNLSPNRVNLLQGFKAVHLSWGRKWRGKVVQHTRDKLIKRDKSTEISPAFKGGKKKGVGYYNAGPITHEALISWLDARQDKDKPFFAYLSYMEAHKPRVPALESRQHVIEDEELIKVGLDTDLTFKSQLYYSYGKKDYTERELEAVNRVYDATLPELDNATADLLDDLEARGILDDTIVIFTSDHGEQLGEHQNFGHRNQVYQSLVHVPLVVAYPRKLSPKRVSTPVSNLRIYDTVLELTGVPKPTDGQRYVQGSLLEAAKQGIQAVFTESISIDRLGFGRVQKAFPDIGEDVWANKYRAVVNGDWKLIQTIDFDTEDVVRHELFHLAEDPHEEENLYEDKPQKADELNGLLETWRDNIELWDATSADSIDNEESDFMKEQLEMLGYIEEDDAEGGAAEAGPSVAADLVGPIGALQKALRKEGSQEAKVLYKQIAPGHAALRANAKSPGTHPEGQILSKLDELMGETRQTFGDVPEIVAAIDKVEQVVDEAEADAPE